jgi:hypothetical protein
MDRVSSGVMEFVLGELVKEILLIKIRNMFKEILIKK